jgi:hypothetical protein
MTEKLPLTDSIPSSSPQPAALAPSLPQDASGEPSATLTPDDWEKPALVPRGPKGQYLPAGPGSHGVKPDLTGKNVGRPGRPRRSAIEVNKTVFAVTTPELVAKVKADYIAGKGSVETCAHLHGANPRVMQQWAVKGRWRQAALVYTKNIEETMLELNRQSMQQFLQKSFRCSTKLMDKAEARLDLDTPDEPIVTLLRVAETIAKAVDIGRKTLGLDKIESQNTIIVDVGLLSRLTPVNPTPVEIETAQPAKPIQWVDRLQRALPAASTA